MPAGCRTAALMITAVALLSACGPPALDTASDEAWARSLEAVRVSLPEEQRSELDHALEVIAFDGLTAAEHETRHGAASDPGRTARLRQRVAGKTAAEVLAEAAVLRDQAGRERLAELRERAATAAAAEAEVAAFEVRSALLHWDRNRYQTDRRIELFVANRSPHRIAAMRFAAVLASGDRDTPWGRDDDLFHRLPSPIPAGETARFEVYVPESSGLAVDMEPVPLDADLEVRMITLYDPEGRPVMDRAGRVISAADRAELAELERRFPAP